MSHCLPSRVWTLRYSKSPCSFRKPGGGFQQLTDRSSRKLGACKRSGLRVKNQAKRLKVYLCVFDILRCVCCWWATGSSEEDVLKLQAECRQEGAGLQQTALSYYWLVCSLMSAEWEGLLIHRKHIKLSLIAMGLKNH